MTSAVSIRDGRFTVQTVDPGGTAREVMRDLPLVGITYRFEILAAAFNAAVLFAVAFTSCMKLGDGSRNRLKFSQWRCCGLLCWACL